MRVYFKDDKNASHVDEDEFHHAVSQAQEFSKADPRRVYLVDKNQLQTAGIAVLQELVDSQQMVGRVDALGEDYIITIGDRLLAQCPPEERSQQLIIDRDQERLVVVYINGEIGSAYNQTHLKPDIIQTGALRFATDGLKLVPALTSEINMLGAGDNEFMIGNTIFGIGYDVGVGPC